MAQPLKLLYSRAYIERLANALAVAHDALPSVRERTAFAPGAFTKAVLGRGWNALELKQRMRRISSTLKASVAGDYRTQLATLERIAPDFSGFLGMFLPDFVEHHLLEQDGLDDFDASVHALELFTQFSSSEFAVRPFIARYGERMMAVMRGWSTHPNEHVRRLASEGCRPRLPWGIGLKDLVRDPAPILPILEQLRADPSEYVRRSVANNLNDIGKDHPELLLDVASRWLGAAPATDKLVKHACRTLMKRGDQRALALFGQHDAVAVKVIGFKLDTTSVAIGSTLGFHFALHAAEDAVLRIEYAIEFVTKSGGVSRKMFKVAEKAVRKDEALHIERRHRFTDFTTRTHYPGRHRISAVVNGVPRATKRFDVVGS